MSLIDCYPSEINQVFLNIITNSIDAIEERIKHESIIPSITIHTYYIDTEWLVIKIADNGLGMEENIQKEIFNPFFTTKSVGKGVGMGMPISYQIINVIHKGNLDCSSVYGQGTEFMIKIPIHHPEMKNT